MAHGSKKFNPRAGIEYWQRRCDTLDQQRDELVYELYGLTDEEIALVEGAGASV